MNVCIVFGGRSGEHEVSLRSAASVVKNLDASKYSVTAIGIDKSGRGIFGEDRIGVGGDGGRLSIEPSRRPISIVPSAGIHAGSERLNIDCVFPVLTGSFGEDGTIQGLLEMADVPYVGAGVLGSAASMDKETAKRLWRDAGVPIVDFAVVHRSSTPEQVRTAAARLGWPLFVKPCAAGSPSVRGVSPKSGNWMPRSPTRCGSTPERFSSGRRGTGDRVRGHRQFRTTGIRARRDRAGRRPHVL